MSRSSVCDGTLGRCATSRAQVEPLAALAAVFAVCVGLVLYAGVLSSATLETGRDLAEPTLDRVSDRISTGGVAVPDRLDAATAVGPAGYELNLSVTAADRRWSVGPAPPQSATDTASRSTGVHVLPGRVEPGRLRVVVWS
jgi:hypothetical protein